MQTKSISLGLRLFYPLVLLKTERVIQADFLNTYGGKQRCHNDLSSLLSSVLILALLKRWLIS